MLNKNHFSLVPVSRVPLSSRLSTLGASRPSLRPGTPGVYVTSSLNPGKNAPVTSPEADDFEKLPVVQNLARFESVFGELAQAVASFQDSEIVGKVEQLIDISSHISLDLCVLRQHQELGEQIAALEQEKEALANENTSLLKGLLACRQDLKKLPKLPAAKDRDPAHHVNETSVQELLDYAMKLAKFSRAPATVNSQMIHPNNYTWPAEDALRRGMLALASLTPDDIIKAEIGEEDVEMKPKPETPEEAETIEAVPEENTLNLDLFNPDEDSE